MAGVWVATLERFGYTLMVVERTKQKALEAMSKEYTDKYFRYNHTTKGAEDFPWYVEEESVEEMVKNDDAFKEYYEMAMEEVYCRKMEYGTVEWC